MKLKVVRNKFLNFYKKKKHIIMPHINLKLNENKLMFVNSGMIQFKKFFLGRKSKYKRICNVQPCFRVSGKHNDFEKIGYTNIHHTLFEMLGNWSFRNYFKYDALFWTWELLINKFKINEKKIWITIHENDFETYNIWRKIGISNKRIIKKKNIKKKFFLNENFWEISNNNGPCGTCSEIFYDMGKKYKLKNQRYVEICNNVFLQYKKKLYNNKYILNKLKYNYIDVGIGLERLTSILQNVNSNYKIDLFKKIINKISDKIKIKNINSLKIISDHIRSACFLISEKIYPSNNKHGYILRKIIRRAIREGYKSNIKNPFFYKISSILIKEMEDFYPFLKKNKNNIKNVIKKEEEKFFNIYKIGIRILNNELKKCSKKLDGKFAFKLYDTYGFPIELLEDICLKNKILIKKKEFFYEMNKQKNNFLNRN
ncbi:putative alanyl-tRNA synthetase [Candidatus Zinderia insecticola CARI]|uniref:Alanine--tRNA ligase n=1 Tax=Zinderia insecticola (strain CARI) TaxID=871271 RepID=E0TIS0_ZINIC|nr:putative alanyl-tRNA synthetase [Candidatus Zinderia insecticola CARI]